jgi:hypothetical protein
MDLLVIRSNATEQTIRWQARLLSLCEPLRYLASLQEIKVSHSSDEFLAKALSTVKLAKEENYCVYAVLRYSTLETWLAIARREHTLAMPLQRHWCRGNLLILSETNFFLEPK